MTVVILFAGYFAWTALWVYLPQRRWSGYWREKESMARKASEGVESG